MEKQACSRPSPLERYHIFKLGHLSHTQLCAAECYCAFLQLQVCYLSLPLPHRCVMCIKLCVSVSQSEAAQHEPKWASRGFGVWRVEVHLAGHFSGLGHSLVHAAVGCAVHGALGVGAAALVVGRVAAAAALVGM